MTETEWLACREVWPMLAHVEDKASERKLRMLACLCCRRIAHLLPVESQECIEVADRYADGQATRNELDAAIEASMRACELLPVPRSDPRFHAVGAVSRVHRDHPNSRRPTFGLAASSWVTAEAVRTRSPGESYEQSTSRHNALFEAEEARQCEWFREVIGNPFRPVAFAPDGRTDTATAIAAGMYALRDFAAMPILADALQDAGCDNLDVLNHCRDASATHVRGCWVVDLVLGKE